MSRDINKLQAVLNDVRTKVKSLEDILPAHQIPKELTSDLIHAMIGQSLEAFKKYLYYTHYGRVLRIPVLSLTKALRGQCAQLSEEDLMLIGASLSCELTEYAACAELASYTAVTLQQRNIADITVLSVTGDGAKLSNGVEGMSEAHGHMFCVVGLAQDELARFKNNGIKMNELSGLSTNAIVIDAFFDILRPLSEYHAQIKVQQYLNSFFDTANANVAIAIQPNAQLPQLIDSLRQLFVSSVQDAMQVFSGPKLQHPLVTHYPELHYQPELDAAGVQAPSEPLATNQNALMPLNVKSLLNRYVSQFTESKWVETKKGLFYLKINGNTEDSKNMADQIKRNFLVSYNSAAVEAGCNRLLEDKIQSGRSQGDYYVNLHIRPDVVVLGGMIDSHCDLNDGNEKRM